MAPAAEHTPPDEPAPRSKAGVRVDPAFLNARKEAWWILASWGICLVWTVGYSAFAGYDRGEGTVALIGGMPAWVVWGVVVPWLCATVFSVVFALFVMSDDQADLR